MIPGMEMYFHRRDEQEERLERGDWSQFPALWEANGDDPMSPVGEIVPPPPPSLGGGVSSFIFIYSPWGECFDAQHNAF